MRRALVALAIGLVVATAVVFGPRLFEDSRLSEERVEALLLERFGDDHRYECRRQEEDDSIPLEDVDYYCESPTGGDAYWVATDEKRLTELLPTA